MDSLVAEKHLGFEFLYGGVDGNIVLKVNCDSEYCGQGYGEEKRVMERRRDG